MNNIWLIDALSRRHVEQAELLAFRGGPALPVAFPSISPLTKSGADSQIVIEGILVPDESVARWFRPFMPVTTYTAIREAFTEAERDSAIAELRLLVNSPGGTVAGLFHTLSQIAHFPKPVSVSVKMATSAAYALAAAPGSQITALGRDATLGSVGVAATFVLSDRVVDVTSRHAPDKRPNPGTSIGKAVIQDYLDEIHDLFVEFIATGRGVGVDRVNQTFGGGRVYLADRAKSLGMIDEVGDYYIAGSGESLASSARRLISAARSSIHR